MINLISVLENGIIYLQSGFILSSQHFSKFSNRHVSKCKGPGSSPSRKCLPNFVIPCHLILTWDATSKINDPQKNFPYILKSFSGHNIILYTICIEITLCSYQRKCLFTETLYINGKGIFKIQQYWREKIRAGLWHMRWTWDLMLESPGLYSLCHLASLKKRNFSTGLTDLYS